tara:strand:+ start:2398 stop:3117 length:720 start_codon:yes stop_codon:yes gene_type:complete
MKIINFKSEPKQSFFAPEWSYYMCEDETLDDNVYFEKIAKIILDKEKQVIDSNLNNYNNYNKEYNTIFDGQTGLGSKSLTSRSPFFNVLSWNEPEIKSLMSFIHFKYIEFLSVLKIDRRKAWIQCWANVMRDDEEIKQHIHASHEFTWLGGHLTVSCNNTSTFYVNPMMRAEGKQTYESTNKVGKMSFFQNNIPHYTNKHKGLTERISIAFDIVLDERLTVYSEERKSNFILFDNPLEK